MGCSVELYRGDLGLDPFAVFLKTVMYSGGGPGRGWGGYPYRETSLFSHIVA